MFLFFCLFIPRLKAQSLEIVSGDTVAPGGSFRLGLKTDTGGKTAYAYKIDLTYGSDLNIKAVNNGNSFNSKSDDRGKSYVFEGQGASGKIDIGEFIFEAAKNPKGKSNTIRVSGKACFNKVNNSDYETSCDWVSLSPATKVINYKSGNNDLAFIKLNGNRVSSFTARNQEYEIVFDKDINKVKIEGEAAEATAKVEGLGERELKYGENSFDINVIAENGATKTYTLKITRKDDRKGDNYLKSILVNNKKIDNFDKNNVSYKIYTYKLYKPDEVKIEAVTNDSKATYHVEKPDKMIIGENIFKVIVKSENEETNTYTVKVINVDEDISKKLKLLSFMGYDFEFDPNKNYYELFYNADKIKKLSIKYKTVAPAEYVDVKINPDIEGSEDLSRTIRTGDSITITITGIDGEKEEYRILFKKDKRLNFYFIMTTFLFIILAFVAYKVYENKKHQELLKNSKHAKTDEPKKEKTAVKEKEEHLEETKELKLDDLKRISR